MEKKAKEEDTHGEDSNEVIDTRPQRSITQSNRITIKERRFANEYIENGWNGTQAALKVYNTTDPSTAAMIASENIRKPKLRHYLEDKGDEAGKILDELMKDKRIKPTDRIKAGTFIYEQAHGKAKQRLELTGKDWGEITVRDLTRLSPKEIEDYRRTILEW